MSYNPEIHHRRSIRLQGNNYSQAGAYFLTLCTYERECFLGQITAGEMHLSPYGRIVESEWLRTPAIRREVELDAFVIMPNHLHVIVLLVPANAAPDVGASGRSPLPTQPSSFSPTQSVSHPPNQPLSHIKPYSIGSLVAGFKSSVTKQINLVRESPGVPVWQQNYYEHIIRNGADLNRIREYIAANPARWTEDSENPDNVAR